MHRVGDIIPDTDILAIIFNLVSEMVKIMSIENGEVDNDVHE